ncbi:MAG: MFS transporter [Anaerolineales bacterium]|nr:MFS transporter [Anaerolineales bacterium]MCX7753660.1 MFS transporter [Anaerolineales bacterium]MDW8279151.1 MFS transporter [Anaerolineales bacterium]
MTTISLWRKMKQYPQLGLVLLAYVAFVALGMPDGLLGVAWPSIRTHFSIPLDAIGILLAAGVTGYMTSSFFSGPLVTRLGVGRVLSLSCALTGLALLGYTLAPTWWVMVLLGIVAGLGAGAIDAGLNTYAAAHFSEGVMQWLHASWGIGITLGPIIMTFGLTTWNAWQFGYQAVSTFQFLLAAGFALTLGMWQVETRPAASETPKKLTNYQTPLLETLLQPRVWMSIGLFFLYVGGETALGTWVYTLLTESRGVTPTAAGFWAGSYWATFTVGRILAGLFARRAGVNLLVSGGLIGALAGSALLVWNPSPLLNLLAVVVIGFSIAPIFPAMMSGTSRRVGEHFAANTIGMQMAATGLGTAVIPGLMGVFARQVSLEVIPWCLLAVYGGLLGLYLLTLRSGASH